MTEATTPPPAEPLDEVIGYAEWESIVQAGGQVCGVPMGPGLLCGRTEFCQSGYYLCADHCMCDCDKHP